MVASPNPMHILRNKSYKLGGVKKVVEVSKESGNLKENTDKEPFFLGRRFHDLST